MLASLLTVPGDADTRRRGQTLILIAALLFAVNAVRVPVTLSLGGTLFFATLPALIGVAGTLGPIWLARKGHVDSAAWLLITTVCVAVSSSPLLQQRLVPSTYFLLLAIMIAGVCLRPRSVGLVTAVTFGFLVAISIAAALNSTHPAFNHAVILAMLLVATGAVAAVGAQVASKTVALLGEARLSAEAAQARVEQLNASLAEQVAAQTAELRQVLTEVERRAAEQQALLDKIAIQRTTIREMSTPVLPVHKGTLVIPLIGDFDAARLADLQTQALRAVERSRAHTLLLDITGVAMINTHVAQGLIETIQATRLLGAEPMLVGVRPEVAQALVAQGISLGEVRVAADLASGLALSNRNGALG